MRCSNDKDYDGVRRVTGSRLVFSKASSDGVRALYHWLGASSCCNASSISR